MSLLKPNDAEKKTPIVYRQIPPKELEKSTKDFLDHNKIYYNYYYDDYRRIDSFQEIPFTTELLLLKQPEAAKVLKITKKSILKLLKHAIDEIECLSKYYNNDERKLIWPRGILTTHWSYMQVKMMAYM
ncbi:hypothetical protein ACTFIU_003481 [Dictyostelium citrinum]